MSDTIDTGETCPRCDGLGAHEPANGYANSSNLGTRCALCGGRGRAVGLSPIVTIAERATRLAIAAGYRSAGIPAGIMRGDKLRAPLGRFEGEPWQLPYFWELACNGDGETVLGADGQASADLFEVSDDERAALGLADDVTHVAVTYSDAGFLGLDTLNCESTRGAALLLDEKA